LKGHFHGRPHRPYLSHALTMSDAAAPVVVVDYEPTWPQAFDRLRVLVAPALAGLPARIEHVGSTAVPGLASKPIIDIDVVCGLSRGCTWCDRAALWAPLSPRRQPRGSRPGGVRVPSSAIYPPSLGGRIRVPVPSRPRTVPAPAPARLRGCGRLCGRKGPTCPPAAGQPPRVRGRQECHHRSANRSRLCRSRLVVGQERYIEWCGVAARSVASRIRRPSGSPSRTSAADH
jgi:hypothetical protein